MPEMSENERGLGLSASEQGVHWSAASGNRVVLPRVLDTTAFFEARYPEVQALQEILRSSGTEGEARRPYKRRRTTSHKRYRHIRRPNVKFQSGAAASRLPTAARSLAAQADNVAAAATTFEMPTTAERRPMNRAMRRRPGHLQAAAITSCAADVSTWRDEHRKLETHMWHVKRMSMRNRWHHVLAEGAAGKGHNSRHLLNVLHTGCLLHDASYCCPAQLSGSVAALRRLLEAVTSPQMAEEVLAGFSQGCLSEHAAMLHHPGSFPAGAVGPIRLMLLPECQTAEAGTATRQQPKPMQEASLRRVWVWLHPALVSTALAMLQDLCQAEGIQLESLTAHIRRLEVRGPTSSAALAELLPGLTCLAAKPPPPDGSVISCTLPDPRLHSPAADRSNMQVEAAADGSDVDILPAATAPAPAAAGAAGDEEPAAGFFVGSDGDVEMLAVRQLPSPLESHSAWSRTLWDSTAALPLPQSGAQVSKWRQQRRLSDIGLNAERPPPATAAATSCPAALVRRRTFGAAAHGWSLLLPAGWVPPVWQALVRTPGVVPAGQREWRWAALDQGCASFPWDYPDAQASASEAAEEAALAAFQCAKATKAKHRYPPAADWGRLGPVACSQSSAIAAMQAPSITVAAQPAAAAAAVAKGDLAAMQPASEVGAAPMDVDGGGWNTGHRDMAAAALPTAAQPPAAGSLAPASAAAGIPGVNPAAPDTREVPEASQQQPSTSSSKQQSNATKKVLKMAAAAATAAAEAQRRQHTEAVDAAVLLLPPGWWVARSTASLQKAFPGVPMLPCGLPAASDCLHKAGESPAQLQPSSQQKQQRQQQDAVRSNGGIGNGPHCSCAGCLIRVRLHMTGRGTAAQGAAVHATTARQPQQQATASSPVASADGFAAGDSPSGSAPGCPSGPKTVCIGFVTTQEPQGACAWAGATALCCATCLSRAFQSQQQSRKKSKRQSVAPGIVVGIEHPTSHEILPAEAFICLAGRAGDCSFF